ncbi:LysR family transcriptional regulator [Fulvimarina endophytica]|uniref:LysR family transcriptional regulator n=1 Tax=Fulvimarina endophytica TaxID=2293836 RepID=A0A371X4K4_9HYPH|nr:LysR family transcriptional regulator [Fulvimarina endophytica]RFC64168.1 LysR family transcriptional regulator [Fulvimarina endophytica]
MDARALPPLSRLRPFEAAIRHESFTAAAAELGLTQTAVTKQIAALEADLGVALFERRNRAVFPTEEGRAFGCVVGRALSEIAGEAARLRGARLPGGVVLHCQHCEAFYWLMPRLPRLHETHPEIELRLVTSLDPITRASEPFDIAIQTSGRPSGSARLAFTAGDEIFPVASPALAGAAPLPCPLPDLSRLPLLSHRVVPQDWLDWPDWFEAFGASLPAGSRLVMFDSVPLVLQAAIAGRGVALGWRRTVEGLIGEGKLVRLCAEALARPAEISVFRGLRGGSHRQTDAVLSWLRAEFEAG